MATPGQVADAIIRRLGSLPAILDNRLADAAGDVRTIEQGVTPVRSGDLRDSETVFGPFERGDMFEARIVPVDIPYAEIVAELDAAHNYPVRGLAAAEGRIEQYRRNLERVLQQTVEG